MTPRRSSKRFSPASILFGAMLVLIAAETIFYGAARANTAVIFAAGQAAICLAGMSSARGRHSLAALPYRQLLPAAVCFLALIAWSLFTIAPSPFAAPEWRDLPHGGVAVDRLAALQQMIVLGGLACVFTIGLIQGGKPRGARTAIVLVAGVIGAYGLWAIIGFLLHPDQLLGAPKTYHSGRLSASFLSANTAASLFGAMAALSIVQLGQGLAAGDWRREQAVWRLAFWTLSFAISVAALFLTASRGGLLATLVVCLAAAAIWLASAIRRGGWLMAGAGLLAIILVVALSWTSLASGEAAARFSVSGEGLAGRFSLFNQLGALIGERWLQGYGLGGFETALLQSLTPADLTELSQIRAAHNIALQWLIEGGLIGALLMFACVGGLLFLAVKRLRLAAPVIAFSAVLILHGVSDYSLQVPAVAAFWTLLLGVSVGQTLVVRGRAKQKRGGEPALRIGDPVLLPGGGDGGPVPER